MERPSSAEMSNASATDASCQIFSVSARSAFSSLFPERFAALVNGMCCVSFWCDFTSTSNKLVRGPLTSTGVSAYLFDMNSLGTNLSRSEE